ncbi:MAG: hypothetical protein AB9915_02610 [Candidatus Dojkabacteria bacterium]
MKNVDVPMWDKGDSTDNFAKGGFSNSPFGFTPPSEKSEEIKKIYLRILGREPSSREISYYKYSVMETNKIVDKLLDGDEHKGILEKAKEYPVLQERNKLSENSILKLKTYIKDKGEEYSELKNLLDEKNSLIEDLRTTKDQPFLTDKKLLEDSNSHYSTSKNKYYTAKSIEEREESLFEKIIKLFFRNTYDK